jgi:hypothetical protein
VTRRAERWPAERFYWAVVEAPQWRRSGPLPLALHEQVEQALPIAAADLHLVCTPLNSGRLLVCGATRSELETIQPDVLSLRPENVPSCLGVPAAGLPLDLLLGQFEPAPFRRARLRLHLLALAALFLVTALLAIGFHRRTTAWESSTSTTLAATAALLQERAPGRTADQLTLDAHRRKAAAGEAARLESPDEATPALVNVLQSWPSNMTVKPLSLNITPGTAAISLTLEGDPSAFIDSFKPPVGWILEEPRHTKAGDTTRLNLQLRRQQSDDR